MHRFRLAPLAFIILSLLLCAPAAAETVRWTVTNHATDYTDELLRLMVDLRTPYDGTRLHVTENGNPVAYQVEVIEGTPEAVHAGHIWVCTSIKSGASHTYKVSTDAEPARFQPRVRLSREGEHYILDNGLIALKVPAASRQMPGPIAGVRPADGEWLGRSRWHGDLIPNALIPRIIGDGPLFAAVQLQYLFTDGTYSGRFLHASFTIRLKPGQPFAHIEESFDMNEGNHWALELHHGLVPTHGLLRGWHSAPGQPDESLRTVPLAPAGHLGQTLVHLQPRWTRSHDRAWFFAAADQETLLGAIVARAGKWHWPYDNLIEVRLDPAGDKATLILPTWRGKRYWLLAVGDISIADNAPALLNAAAFQHLDKLTHDYILDFPGQPPGAIGLPFFYSTEATDPSDQMRALADHLMKSAREGTLQADRQTLALFQTYLDPDWFPRYRNHWSPIDPALSTDLLRIPIAMAVALKTHPQFPTFARMAEEALRTELDFAVTLPGGAGQTSPAQLARAMKTWLDLADIAREHLGFDPRQWPRFKAAASFLLHTSQPLAGGGRRILPLGDTCDPGPDVVELARMFGIEENISDFVSEELPGFGVIFRSHSGTDRESFLAFKAGPNRARSHGDQLSFHYVTAAQRLAIDHTSPGGGVTADQEHMHNRVSFSTDHLEHANTDGYERLIAFTTGPEIDVAVGQVESRRLRPMPRAPEELPPDPIRSHKRLDEKLTYRRTIAFIKQRPGAPNLDYFVVRDQHRGPDLKATYNLHVESDRCIRSGGTIDFGKMILFVAEPEQFELGRFDWAFRDSRSGYGERTIGARLSVRGRERQFITVLYPSGEPPRMRAVPGGVQLSFNDGQIDEVIFAEEGRSGAGRALVNLIRNGRPIAALKDSDINLDRSQGEIGLFIPERGGDLGPVPEWLLDQRSQITTTAD